MLIDDTLEDEVAGVQRSETSVRAGRTLVHADGTVAPQQIIDAIVGTGYHAALEASA